MARIGLGTGAGTGNATRRARVAAAAVARQTMALLDGRAPGVAHQIRAAIGRAVPPDAGRGGAPLGGAGSAVPGPRPGAWVDRSWDFDPAGGDLPWIYPFPFAVDAALRDRPALVVLVPGLRASDLSGGPNTAIQLAYRLAARGRAVRFVSTDVAVDDVDALRRHMATITGLPVDVAGVEITSAATGPIRLGENDVVLATAWWTAQLARRLVTRTRAMRFLYLVQDYEPLFYRASTAFALADETYALDHVPIVNSRLLLDHLRTAGVGRYADPAFAARAIVVEPAVDTTRFFRRPSVPGSPLRLLLYARPDNGARNLFELAVEALRLAARRGAFDGGDWELIGIGEPFPDQVVSATLVLRPHPWLTIDGYADLLGTSDLLVSLMLSPHPSYPPLEMAASGGLVVTNSFGVKTADRLAELAPGALVAEPTVESVAESIVAAARQAVAARQVVGGTVGPGTGVSLPASWAESFAPVLDRVEGALDELRRAPDRLDEAWRSVPRSDYDAHRLARVADRRRTYTRPVHAGMLSLLTPAWNTDAGHLRVLARSVFEQGGAGDFEWVLVDNGSDRPETIALLDQLAAHPVVRFARLDRNRGIVGGMRACLERATGEYAVALDHDDLLAPDALWVVGQWLDQEGRPALFYSDEDAIDLDVFRDPYFKPDWDPVLFANSCYVAHLSGIRRELALELGAYTDEQAEASPDWDLFARAVVAGHEPRHVPEVLYSWRVHPDSTAGGHDAKAYVAESQRAVVVRLLAAVPNAGNFTIEPNPFSPGHKDWWTRRRPTGGVDVPTVVFEGGDDPSHLAKLVADVAGERRLVHLRLHRAQSSPTALGTSRDSESLWEAVGLVDRFPDTAVVGGRLVRGGVVVGAAGYFGFGRGWDGPERGQAVDDFGHLALTAKQRSVDVVPAEHCVADVDLVLQALGELARRDQPIALLGPWLGALARRAGRRVVVSPHVVTDVDRTLDDLVTPDQRRAFLCEHRDLLGTTPTLSRSVDLRVGHAFAPADDAVRAAHLTSLIEGVEV